MVTLLENLCIVSNPFLYCYVMFYREPPGSLCVVVLYVYIVHLFKREQPERNYIYVIYIEPEYFMYQGASSRLLYTVLMH